ncbi:22449_t:CDS:2, partial [Gigaspora margarita]
MAVDVETTKVNSHKAPIELDIYGSQNESKEGDYSPKRRETTHLIVQELPKPPTPYRKRNDIVNSALIEINPSKVSDESNMEINPMQEDEIIVPAKQILANQPILSRIRKEIIKRSLILWDIPNETRACQIRKNLSFYGRLMVKSFKANGKSKATFVEIDNHNMEGKEIVTGSNAIKIINKRSFSSSGNNRDINSQKVISGRTRHEFLKEQDKKPPR